MDPVRLSKTMAFLLRHRPDIGDLKPDPEGWVEIDDLCGAVSRLMRHEVRVSVVERLVEGAGVQRFEIQEQRIRAVRRKPQIKGGKRCRHPRVRPPDILYHATTQEALAELHDAKALTAPRDRFVYLSGSEADAWRVAHRMSGTPHVLYVDATRAGRHGVRFFRNRRSGLYLSTPVPVADILNLQKGFDHQYSAGGFPVVRGEDGVPRLALVQVTRRSGVTWEVAKGKLERAEPPERAAVREVQEEMGIATDMRITHDLGMIRYGFLAPGRLPRLKTVHLYLMEPTGPIEGFSPADGEGITGVRWFTPDDAVDAVTHTSLKPLMFDVRDLLAASPRDD